MSTAMPVKKKVEAQSSTESSSGSTSDSSSSSSSTSGSGSSSSSDSDSTSSRSSKIQSESEHKKTAPLQKTQRKSSESSSKATVNKTNDKPSVKTKQTPQKVQKQTSKTTIYSSEDERNTKMQTKTIVKRKSAIKPKVTANATVKSVENLQQKPTGTISNKLQKSPIKQTIIAQKSIHKPVTGKTAPKPTAKQQKVKEKQKPVKGTNNSAKLDLNKKKSIFSPENSSESDSENKITTTKSQNKPPPVKPRPKATAKEKPKVHEKLKTEPKPGPKSKAIISSASSASTTSDTNSSTSESESSGDSSSSKKDSKKSIKKAKEIMNSDSENESQSGKQITRKLTRSSSTRISKHVVGKTVYSDTDSDTESTKRSLSRSPVKRAPVATKGKAKNKRNDTKIKNEIIIMEERKCPIEGCNSFGHIGGKLDKHFTVDACPGYHNMTMTQCKEQLVERKKREDSRRKTLEAIKKSPRAQALQEQKAFQQKVKDMRAKFKQEIIEDVKPHVDKNREPDLSNFVPDYDLKLFKDAQAMASEKIEEDLKSQPNTKGTKYIEMGKFEMEVWYQSPYPEDYARLPKLYICEYCLRYMKSRTILERHVVKCVWRHPPGEEVYRKDKISVWEVDGKRYKLYCQNLCLLAKFFLDHKTLYYDVEPFLFYVMTMVDNEGCHTVGYFSKEKNSFLNYNVSCILTLPPYQRQGYGRLLIDFSYLLTRVEGKIGSPEKPLSDLGLISYRSYWKDVLLNYLCKTAGTQLSVKDISQEMAIHSYDIVSTLQALGMMKYWKGKHIILRKQDVLDEYVERVKRRGPLLKEVDPTCLRWTPFVPPQPNPA